MNNKVWMIFWAAAATASFTFAALDISNDKFIYAIVQMVCFMVQVWQFDKFYNLYHKEKK